MHYSTMSHMEKVKMRDKKMVHRKVKPFERKEELYFSGETIIEKF
jgi:hypothetical protein